MWPYSNETILATNTLEKRTREDKFHFLHETVQLAS